MAASTKGVLLTKGLALHIFTAVELQEESQASLWL